MKKSLHILSIITVIIAIYGCASVDGLLPASKEKQALEHLETGQRLESNGELLAALDQYKMALAIIPDYSAAQAKKSHVEKKIRAAAARHYRSGLKLHRKGKYDLARNEFLAALRFQPNHPGAIQMLKPRKQIEAKRFVAHRIKPGESLSKIAILYYGDYKKFPLIAQFNDITDATKVTPGDLIKIPEIEGVPFLVGDKAIESDEIGKNLLLPQNEAQEEAAIEQITPDLKMVSEPEELAAPEEKPIDERIIEKKPTKPSEPTVPTAISHHDSGVKFFDERKYQEAIVEFEKALTINPEDKKTLNYMYLSHFQPAMVFFEKGDYLAAKREFEEAMRYNKNCDTCVAYSQKSEAAYKELHYNKGISYFANEQLVEAIEEWELVSAVDSGYKTVQDNIKRAKRFLERLQEIQKSAQ
ncbi:MAG: hypothetical protein JRH15_09660 [Deltaproteobacteria bacterium]|nr:hypothetical protein [Deltaproteobacteria bacterium]